MIIALDYISGFLLLLAMGLLCWYIVALVHQELSIKREIRKRGRQ